MTGNRKYLYPYGVVWLSPTSLSDFDRCPRLYYLRNMYKNLKTNRKIQIVNPYLTLGGCVHQTIDSISHLPKNERFANPLTEKFEQLWAKTSGKVGGFTSGKQEQIFKERGLSMIKRLMNNPGPLANLANKIHEVIPNMWLSEKDMLVLCGVVDWIEVLPDNTLHIIDFKTGKNEEDIESLQLGIYLLLVKSKLKREVSKVSYWYLDREDTPKEAVLLETDVVLKTLIDEGKKVKKYRLEGEYSCPKGGCTYCLEYEMVLQGKAEHVDVDIKMKRDLYFLSR